MSSEEFTEKGKNPHTGEGRVDINPTYWPVVYFAFLLVTDILSLLQQDSVWCKTYFSQHP